MLSYTFGFIYILFKYSSRLLLSQGIISSLDLHFFLQGSSTLELPRTKPSNCEWIPEKCWKDIVALCDCKPIFNGFDKYIASNCGKWLSILESKTPFQDVKKEIQSEGKFNDFHALMILRCIRLDAIVPSVMSFVKKTLGRKYIETPQFNLKASFEDSKCTSPIIFVLTPGSDPVSPLMELARELKIADNVVTISMGQGQGSIAENAIQDVSHIL